MTDDRIEIPVPADETPPVPAAAKPIRKRAAKAAVATAAKVEAATAAKRARRAPRAESPTKADGAAGVETTTGPKRARRAGLPARNEPVPGRAEGDEGARQALELGRKIVDLAADKKAADIVLIHVGELTTLADYLVICSGGSERQLGAIADGIIQGLKDDGVVAIGREGESSAHWVLIDYGSVIVHVFAQPERDFYQLEKLWADAPMLLRVQ